MSFPRYFRNRNFSASPSSSVPAKAAETALSAIFGETCFARSSRSTRNRPRPEFASLAEANDSENFLSSASPYSRNFDITELTSRDDWARRCNFLLSSAEECARLPSTRSAYSQRSSEDSFFGARLAILLKRLLLYHALQGVNC